MKRTMNTTINRSKNNGRSTRRKQMKCSNRIKTISVHGVVLAAVFAQCACSGLFAAPAVTLENDAMAISFSSSGSGFAVTSIVNRLGGETRFVDTNLKGPDFWAITLVPDGGVDPKKAVHLQNHTPSKERTCEKIENGYAFNWKGMSIPGNEGEKECVDVRAEVRLPPGCAKSEWTISAQCRSAKWALAETRYPCFKGMVKSGEADVLMPNKGYGARLHKAYATAKGEVGKIGYPGWFPMVCAYIKDGAGLYLAAHDPDGRNKALVFERGADVSFQTPVEDSGVLGKAAEGPRYAVTLAAFKGDWWQAAHLYREWAVKQKWCAKGRIRDRADYPKAMSDIDVWLLAPGDPKSVSNCVMRARAAMPGMNLAFHWYNWNVEPFDTHYPEFLPKRGVKETCEWMASLGVISMPYINGRIWDQSLASAPYALGDACMKPGGGAQIESYNNRTFAVMCPCAKGWQDVLMYNATNVVFGCATTALYYDQISCSRPQPCFNPAHGHPLGGGSWWDDGYRKALVPIHEALSAKGVPLTSEGMAENWMDVVEGHLHCHDPDPEDVPFYPAVYSGYTTYFGTRFQPIDAVETAFAVQARGLVWGMTPGWSATWILNKGKDAWLDCVRKAGVVRRAAREFLAYGTLVDELRLEEKQPVVQFDMKRKKNRTKPAEPYEYFMPAVFGTVWKDSSGKRTAVIAVNVSDEKRTVRFRLPAGVKTLSSMEGVPAAEVSVSGDMATLAIAPRQYAALVD